MSLSSTPDLTTYEGRREAWVLEMLSNDYLPYLGGGLESRKLVEADGRKFCCCLGVACELIIRLEPSLIHITDFRYGHSLEFGSTTDPEDKTQGFLPRAAAMWLGVDPQPYVTLDQKFVDELAVENARLKADGEYAIIIPGGSDPNPIDPSRPYLGNRIGLHTLNDNGCPWTIIAGLITRGCIHGAKTGPVEA